MKDLPITFQTLFIVWLINFLLLSIRYVVFAGVAYSIFWIWKRDKWQYKRTQIEYPDRSKILYEFKYSMITMTIFALVGVGIFTAKKNGFTFLYNDISERGIFYFIFSIFAAIFIHDTFFYWSHRIMHHKLIYKYVHKVHHNSTNPSPWAAFSFHPSESIIEAMIVPILVLIMPIHPLAILAFLLYMTFMNVLGHLGFEMYPNGFTTHWFGKWHNTATHHNMHHRFFNCNYGLYFNYWDRLMGTNHPNYHRVFDEVSSRKAIMDA